MISSGPTASCRRKAPRCPLEVRAQPAGAPQPWLPLRGLRLRYLAAPAQARSGEATEIVVEAVAQGATEAQFPEIPVPQVEGAQVFAERAENSERFVDGGPQLTAVRRFSVVPLRAGALRVPGPRMGWWDASADSAQEARLPDLQLQVVVGAAAPAAADASRADAPVAAVAAPVRVPDSAAGPGAGRQWRWLAMAFALLWLLTLALLLWSRHRRGDAVRDAAVASAPPRRPAPADLRRVLDAGGFDEAVQLLQRMATPPAAGLDEVISRLGDPAQREALAAMRRALWAGDGEPARARAALRAAFRDGPRWEAGGGAATAPLPPLYPPR